MIPRTIDLQDQRPDRGVPLAERYERFIGHFCETRNPGQAFRIAFVPDRSMSVRVVNELAARLLKDPGVQARSRELLDAAVAATTCSVRELLQTYYEIATADPNEIISYVIDCCRHCYGLDHAYQWVDEAEYARKVQETMDWNAQLPANAPAALRRTMPEMAGGFGFWPTHDPNPACPFCFGRGDGRALVHDTTKLSPAARKLYKGVKETKNGIEVLMHDQSEAAQALLRVAGAFKDAVPLTPPPLDPDGQQEAIPTDASEAEVGRAYLRLVAGAPVR